MRVQRYGKIGVGERKGGLFTFPKFSVAVYTHPFRVPN
jgi:hypothetical protein